MQKKKLVIIALTLVVMLSVFQLTDLVLYHAKSLQEGSLIQLKYLMLAHVFLIMMLIALFFFQDFHINILIAFLYCFVTSVTFTICEEALDALPAGNHRENFLIFHKLGKYQKGVETNYLSLYTLLYMYSVIGAIVLGIFFLVRIILVKYYSRQLGRELETQVLQISFNSDLKGKDCIVCLNQFEDQRQKFYQLKNCHHIFHSKCLREWVNYSRTCPICRNSIFPLRRSSSNLAA